MHDAVAYMKQAGVRVCNMSWGGSRKDIEDSLEKKGVGKDTAERAELARTLFKIQRDALEERRFMRRTETLRHVSRLQNRAEPPPRGRSAV